MPLPPTPAAVPSTATARLAKALGKDIGAALERAGERLDYLWRNPDKLHYLMTGFPDDLEGTFAQESPHARMGVAMTSRTARKRKTDLAVRTPMGFVRRTWTS
jgi:hypothetical protein